MRRLEQTMSSKKYSESATLTSRMLGCRSTTAGLEVVLSVIWLGVPSALLASGIMLNLSGSYPLVAYCCGALSRSSSEVLVELSDVGDEDRRRDRVCRRDESGP
jgi:hypothetical protein